MIATTTRMPDISMRIETVCGIRSMRGFSHAGTAVDGTSGAGVLLGSSLMATTIGNTHPLGVVVKLASRRDKIIFSFNKLLVVLTLENFPH